MWPHHVECLTRHVKSVKDDVLNTRYYSHYENPDDGNKKKPEVEEAISGLEQTMKEMKDKIKMYQMAKGIYDPDRDFDLMEDNEIKRQARWKFDDLLSDKNP